MKIECNGIYESIWTGDVDEIIGYEDGYIIVKDTATKSVRKHLTNIVCHRLSTSSEYISYFEHNHTKENLDAIVFLLEKGFPIFCFSGLREYKRYAQINYLINKVTKNHKQIDIIVILTPDKYYICKDCGKKFGLYNSEIKFYNSNGLKTPLRCKYCRNKRKNKK